MGNINSWLNINPTSGTSGETQLSLTALTNTSLQAKTATITAKNDTYNVQDTTTVTIQGFQPTLTLSRSTLRFDSTGGTATFTVYSNTAWTINFPALVHSYSTSAGTGDTEVSVVVGQNLDEVGKVDTGIVKDVYNVNQLYLTIVQDSFISELAVTPDDDIIFANTGSSTSITIDTNTDWEIEYPSWVVPSIVSGESGTTTVTFTAGENGPTDRSGQITIYAGSKYVTIDVFQPFYIPPYITVTPSAWTFNYTEDGKTFIVDSYPEWTAEIVSTGETVWASDAYMEAVFDIPSAMTMPLWVGNNGSTTGIYLGPIRHYGSSVTFPSSGTYVVRYEMLDDGTTPVLQGNQYLKEINLTDGVGAIQSSAFTGCTALSSVTIGSGLSRVGTAAFSGCSSLDSITITAPTAPSVCANTFYGVASGGTLHWPDGSNYYTWLSPYAYCLGYYGWNDGNRPPVPTDNLFKYATVFYTVTSTTNPITVLNEKHYFSLVVDGNGNQMAVQPNEWGSLNYTFSSTGKQQLDFYVPFQYVGYDGSTGAVLNLNNILEAVDVTLYQHTEQIGTYKYSHIGVSQNNNITALTVNAMTDTTSTDFQYHYPKLKVLKLGGNTALKITNSGQTGYTLSLEELEITSSSIYSLEGSQFYRCTHLKKLTLGPYISQLGPSTFRLCSSLNTIYALRETRPSGYSETFYGAPNTGTLYYPVGSDYSYWLNGQLSGWTGVEI